MRKDGETVTDGRSLARADSTLGSDPEGKDRTEEGLGT